MFGRSTIGRDAVVAVGTLAVLDSFRSIKPPLLARLLESPVAGAVPCGMVMVMPEAISLLRAASELLNSTRRS